MESPPAGSGLPTAEAALLRLTRDLDRWGGLFLRVAGEKEPPAVEQVLGGLVEWMGSDLVEGWLRLPIPLFEEVSGLAEELFRACESYLGWIRQAPRPVPPDGRGIREAAIRAVLDRVRALGSTAAGRGS